LDDAANLVRPILREAALHTFLGSGERRRKCADVPPVLLRNATVGKYEPAHLLVELTCFEELYRRDYHAFLEAVAGVRCDRARHYAADVGGMDETPGEADELATREDRSEHHVVRQVSAHALRVYRIVRKD